MTPERWSQIKDIFSAVIDRSPEERQSALTEACQGDLELQQELRRLLAQHDEMGEFLDGSPPASTSSLLSPGYLVANRYEVVSLLGTGGMGEVYEVEDQELGGRIALKVIHPQVSFNPSALDRFRREVQLARQVTHPNVCRVFDIGHHQQNGREIIFLTMELIQGETLAARLKRDGRIGFGEAQSIALQICQGLGAAHQAGILHRDFKCGNVMLIGNGETVRAVITDFGIARWMRSAEDSTGAVTTQGAIFGTPAYMSPEQIQGKELTIASDIYSLGLVLYEMVTGTRPFKDESPWAEALKRLTETAKPPAKIVSGLDSRWNDTILRCLQNQPERRFASAFEVHASLRQSNVERVFHSGRRRLVATAVLILIVLTTAMVIRGRLAAHALPAIKHIAVLPFASAENDPGSQAVTDQLAESLSGNLAHLQSVSNDSFWVVPWKSVQRRPRNDEQHAGAALGANLLVTGILENHDDRKKLSVKVKDAATLQDLRLQVIEIPPSRLTATEDILLESVSRMLELRVSPQFLDHLAADETKEPGAYEFYQQGRGYLAHHDRQNVDRAIVLFQKAIAKDDNFALAYASLASAYAWKFNESKDPSWLEKSQQACTRALSLNNMLATAHLVQGRIYGFTGNVTGAIQSLKKALELDPLDDDAQNDLAVTYENAGQLLQAESLLKEGLSHNHANWVNYDFLGAFYYRHQQYKQAEPLFRTAMELAPDNPIAFYNLAGLYIKQRKCKEAEPILVHAISVVASGSTYSNLGTVYFCLGDYAKSVAMFQKATELRPLDHRLWRNLGDAYTSAGNRMQATQAYEKARELVEKALTIDPKNPELLGDAALYYAKLDERAKAEQMLGRAPRSAWQNQDFMLVSAETFEKLGNRKRALATIQDLLQAGYPQSEIENDFELAELQKDLRYEELIRHQFPGSSGPDPTPQIPAK